MHGVCSRCGDARPEAFSPSQLAKRTAWCKACFAKYRRGELGRRWQDTERAKRIAWLHSVKVASGCQRCDEKDPVCLDFHHVDESTKRFNIASNIHNMSRKTMEDEIAKTIVLCSNCHRKLHYYERSGTYARAKAHLTLKTG